MAHYLGADKQKNHLCLFRVSLCFIIITYFNSVPRGPRPLWSRMWNCTYVYVHLSSAGLHNIHQIYKQIQDPQKIKKHCST